MELIGSGRDANVYAYAEGLVLRRYRDGRPAGEEAEVMRRLTCAGYPVPKVHRVSGPEIVLQRVEGPTLAEAMVAGDVTVAEGATLLAELHDRLHAIDWPDGVLLHLDLHPLNVILSPDGPVVVDWSNARPGDPGLDVALTVLILAQLEISPGMLPSQPDLEEGLRPRLDEFLRTFVAAVSAPYVDQIDEAVEFRRGDPNQTGEELSRLKEAAERAEALASEE
ncbi:phosphotransferase [Nocardioides cheoyonin]|uniref:phosphotransferase n=1 Tax=Nocardioides cheoyonin TaxID=3156615 RepID=UPI0032B55D95